MKCFDSRGDGRVKEQTEFDFRFGDGGEDVRRRCKMMKPAMLSHSLCAVAILIFVGISAAFGQPSATKKPEPEKAATSTFVTSPAYAELLLKRTELQSDLESLSLEYTEEYPKLKEIRFVSGLLDRDMARLSKVKAADSGRLTLALGKLMMRRIELETDVWKLQASYKDEHPDVKRAKRKVEIYETAISQILN